MKKSKWRLLGRSAISWEQVNDWDTMVARLLTLRKEQPIHGFKTCGAAGARGDGFNQTYLNGNDMAMLLLEEMEQDAKEGK